MSLILPVALAVFSQSGATPFASWDTLAGEYERIFQEWVREREHAAAGAEEIPHPAAAWWARFEALADAGEGRATLWLLANLGQAPRPDAGASLLVRVRRGGDEEWVGTAFFELGANAPRFPEQDLVTLLEERMATSELFPLRARAALALAQVVRHADPDHAAYLRVWAPMLQHRSVDLAPEETLAREDVDELGTLLIDAVEKEAASYFSLAYKLGSDDVYYPVSGAPPDPEALWRPSIEELATRGSQRATLWAIQNAPWQLDEAGKARLKGFLAAAASAQLSEDQLARFGWQVGGLVYRLGLADVEPVIRGLIDRSPDKVKPGLLFGLGDAVCETAGEDAALCERGLAMLREVRERFPDAGEAKRAEGRIFRYTNLAVGKTAPDFETVDPDGNAFKLSDYKGKVTVIDFWGFW